MNALDVLTALDRIGPSLVQRIRPGADLETRAAAALDILRGAWPDGTLFACRLEADHLTAEAAADQAGSPVRLNGADSWTASAPVGKGMLGLKLPASGSAEPAELAGMFVRCFARLLEDHLALLASREVREERDTLERLAAVADLAGPLAHEVNDFLNMVLLHVTILQMKLPEEDQTDLAEIQRQGTRASELVNYFQQSRRSHAGRAVPVVLEQAVRQVATALSGELAGHFTVAVHEGDEDPADADAVSLRLAWGPAPPAVRGPAISVRRLLHFLLENALRSSAVGGKKVLVAVEAGDDGGRVCIEDSGPPLAPEQLPHVFVPGRVAREGFNGLELAASVSLARRLGGKLSVENGADGGVRLVAEFAPA